MEPLVRRQRRGIFALLLAALLFTALGVCAETKSDETKKKKRHHSQEEADSSPSPKKSPTPKPKSSPNKKSSAKKHSVSEKSKAGSKSSAAKKSKAKPEKTPAPKAKAKPVEKEIEAPKASAVPSPSATIPRAVAATTPAARAVASVVPAEITIQKSGVEEEQGYEPPPPAPRSFWSRVFGRSEPAPVNYRYLNRGVIDAIRRAPVLRGRWKFIVVHNSGTRQGNARAFDYYHRHVRRMSNGLAYHFVIGNGTSSGNGEIEIGDRWRRQINGGHVHSDYLNNIALGICLVGDFNRDQPTRAQLDSCEELIRYLRIRCGKADGHELLVRPHREVNPPQWATDCPGDAFPYQWFDRFRN